MDTKEVEQEVMDSIMEFCLDWKIEKKLPKPAPFDESDALKNLNFMLQEMTNNHWTYKIKLGDNILRFCKYLSFLQGFLKRKLPQLKNYERLQPLTADVFRNVDMSIEVFMPEKVTVAG